MKRRLVDAYVPGGIDGLRLRIEFDFVRTKRNGNGFGRSRWLGKEPSARPENDRRRSGRDPAMREVPPSAPRAQTRIQRRDRVSSPGDARSWGDDPAVPVGSESAPEALGT